MKNEIVETRLNFKFSGGFISVISVVRKIASITCCKYTAVYCFYVVTFFRTGLQETPGETAEALRTLQFCTFIGNKPLHESSCFELLLGAKC